MKVVLLFFCVLKICVGSEESKIKISDEDFFTIFFDKEYAEDFWFNPNLLEVGVDAIPKSHQCKIKDVISTYNNIYLLLSHFKNEYLSVLMSLDTTHHADLEKSRKKNYYLFICINYLLIHPLFFYNTQELKEFLDEILFYWNQIISLPRENNGKRKNLERIYSCLEKRLQIPIKFEDDKKLILQSLDWEFFRREEIGVNICKNFLKDATFCKDVFFKLDSKMTSNYGLVKGLLRAGANITEIQLNENLSQIQRSDIKLALYPVLSAFNAKGPWEKFEENSLVNSHLYKWSFLPKNLKKVLLDFYLWGKHKSFPWDMNITKLMMTYIVKGWF